MIGRISRPVLTVAAYGIAILGVLRGVELMYPFATGWSGPMPYDVWTAARDATWSVVSSIVQGGILLALLSIDERIQKRGA